MVFFVLAWKVENYSNVSKTDKMALSQKEVCFYFPLVCPRKINDKFKFTEAAQIMHEICAAVKYLHDLGKSIMIVLEYILVRWLKRCEHPLVHEL